MEDPKRRADKWRAKFDTERVKQTLDGMREGMAARYQAAAARLVAMELEVKQVLDQEGVQTILYVPYLNFGRQLYKLSNQQNISGESFAMAAKVLLDKWAARGLDPDVLANVRTKVFYIGEPKP
jgi:hypothetical protein